MKVALNTHAWGVPKTDNKYLSLILKKVQPPQHLYMGKKSPFLKPKKKLENVS
jgi:hypothetical protein